MSFVLEHQNQEKLMKLLEVRNAGELGKGSVLGAFEKFSAWIMMSSPRAFGDDSYFAATEWLLYAHEQGELDINVLQAIIEHKINYTSVFCYLGGEPKDYGEGFKDKGGRKWWQRKHDRSKYVKELAKREMRGDFVGTIKWLAEYLSTKNMKKSSVSKSEILSGRSPEYLLHLWDFNRYDSSGRPQDDKASSKSGACVYAGRIRSRNIR